MCHIVVAQQSIFQEMRGSSFGGFQTWFTCFSDLAFRGVMLHEMIMCSGGSSGMLDAQALRLVFRTSYAYSICSCTVKIDKLCVCERRGGGRERDIPNNYVIW